MSTYNSQEENIANGGGLFGGAWAMIILVVVVLWLLFKDGHRDGRGDGYGYGQPYVAANCCGTRPTFYDESNFEEERNINGKLCCIDKEVIEQGCKDREATHCEGEKTRALIEQNYIQDLRDKLAEKNSEISTLKSEAFTKAEIGGVMAAICKTDVKLEQLGCEMLKRPPVWGEAVTPVTREFECRTPKRSNCCFDEC